MSLAMNIFDFRDALIEHYKTFSRSFTQIASQDIRDIVDEQCQVYKRYWPEPLLQINPCYEQSKTVAEYCQSKRLHPECEAIFRDNKGQSIRLFAHQDQAIDLAISHKSFVVTTGTGSGKSLSFFIPIIDRILKEKSAQPEEKPRTRAIILYPMNALANSQLEEIAKFLKHPNHCTPLSVERYTGQESEEDRQKLYRNPPDILLTNYMMLELLLMRQKDRALIDNCKHLEFLVLDELHTYRGRQGSDVAMLVRRLRSQLEAQDMICIGTSATMSSVGSRSAQLAVVAQFASKIFGTPIAANQVISETLSRVTHSEALQDSQGVALHKAVIDAADHGTPFSDYEQFRNNALSIWLENNLSITREEKRAVPLPVSEVIDRLAKQADVPKDKAEKALKQFLAQFGTEKSVKMPNGRSPFAFKLHQFISAPGKVYLTLEAPGERIVTLDGQSYVNDPKEPGRKLPLFETYFCLDCGQEYIPVWFERNGPNITRVTPRSIDEVTVGDRGKTHYSYGYVCPATDAQAFQTCPDDLPDDWFDPKNPKVRAARKKVLPQLCHFAADGSCQPSGQPFWVLPGNFRLCMRCLRSYEARGRDKNRLMGLSGEGRSSATTVITLQILRQLYNIFPNSNGQPDYRKLLGFSDNRQDAALQAGHFNDFLNRIILRGGVVRALQSSAGPLKLDALVERICALFHFDNPFDASAMQELLRKPSRTTGLALQKALSALHFSLSYHLLRDLRDRNLYTSPSLEKLGLMEISYQGLHALCHNPQAFAKSAVLTALSAEKREELLRTFLDEVRRHQCLSTHYFRPTDPNVNRARELLNPRWSLPETSIQTGESAFVLDAKQAKAWAFGKPYRFSERSGLITMLSKHDLWKDVKDTLPVPVTTHRKDMQTLVCEMTECLCLEGILKQTKTKFGSYYQLDQDAILWSYPQSYTKSSVNAFFRKLYIDVAQTIGQDTNALLDFEAQEHTAQVSNQEREALEMRFRANADDVKKWPEEHPDNPFKRLPVLYCSPTMELGIDISALNYVYMRNIPPTAANYVQRAGRAGRSGQQALSVSYCTAMSPHDQWFFNHPAEMVQGVVKEPTLDLSNETLIKTHLHSVWMTAARVDLPTTVSLVLDLKQSNTLPVKNELMQILSSPSVTQRAIELGQQVLAQVQGDLNNQPWFVAHYVESVMQQAADEFAKSFDNWRSLYNATLQQMELAYATMSRPGVSAKEQSIAQRRLNDANRQKALLESNNLTSANNDFYTYRYLANQGFLPGYNFPTMPLLAWIPESPDNGIESTMLSRARFLGLSEFGPKNVIYHRGRIYRIDRLKIHVQENSATASNELPTSSVLVCPHCGYAHILDAGKIFNTCENCSGTLSAKNAIAGLYKVTTVETVEIEHISIRDENRRSQGYDMQTLYQFAKDPNTGAVLKESTEICDNGQVIATMTYAPAASVWRVNLGWRHRVNQKTKGFSINPLTGVWSEKGPDTAEDEEETEKNPAPQGPFQTIVPYVTDTRNILLFEPKIDSALTQTMATLQACLKRAIEQAYQIESSEIFVEPLPNSSQRNMLLIYESGEGGSGVLHDIIRNPDALGKIARQALELMHYKVNDTDPLDASTLHDDKPDCINGCYDCLLTYYNQPEHILIDRHDEATLRFLVALTRTQPVATATRASVPAPAQGTFARFCQWAAANGYCSPNQQPKVFNRLNLSFDGAYSAFRVCISFAPVNPEDIQRLEDVGWQVLDLSDENRWAHAMGEHPELLINS